MMVWTDEMADMRVDVVGDLMRQYYERKEALMRGYIVWVVLTAGPDSWMLTPEGVRFRLREWYWAAPEITFGDPRP